MKGSDATVPSDIGSDVYIKSYFTLIAKRTVKSLNPNIGVW